MRTNREKQFPRSNFLAVVSRPAVAWMAVGTVLLAGTGGPPVPDRDGDGWPDALEHFLGTNPLDRQSVFAIRELARLQSPARTELRWPSASGRSYRIEASDTLAATGWQPVATVTGTGGVMVHEVAESAFPGAKFFRLVTDYDTALPPWTGEVEAPGSAVTSTGATMLRIHAWHPNGVDEVVFRRGGRVLGAATLAGDHRWELPWHADVADNGLESVTAEARRGNTITLSQSRALEVNITLPPQPEYLAQNPDQFVLLDAQGNPLGGAPVRADALGNLPPCEFRPAGFSVAGAPASLAVRLPSGARITGAPGAQVLEFPAARLVSGAEGPMVIDELIEATGPRTLSLGPVTVAQLVTLFGLPAGDGVPVKIAGHFPARITGGSFSIAGFTAPEIRLDPGVLPFGEVLGAFNGLTMELGERGFVRLPLSGDYPLDQIGGPAATLSIGAQEPAWVRFGFDGSLSMSGKGSLVFAEGPSFEVGLTLDGPIAAFEFRVGKMHARVSGEWLSPNLPPAEVLNLGTVPDAPTLEAARLSLQRKSLVFERFSTAFAASVIQSLPRPNLGGLPSPLEVLGLSKLAGATGLDVNAPEVKAAMEQAARAAAASRKATEAAEHWFSLERLRLSGLTPPGLDSARSETRAALKNKLEKPVEPLSLVALREVLRIGVARWKLAQETNWAFDHDGLETSLELAITNALGSHAASLGITAGQTGTASTAMAARDRFVIYHELNELFSIWQAAQQLGLDVSPDALLTELLAQSGLALEPKLRQALWQAELAVDEMAFLDALAEYLYLHQLAQQGVFGVAPAWLLSTQLLADRAGKLAAAVAALPRPQRPVAKRFQEVKRMGEILAAIPVGVTYPAPPVLRAYNGLLDSINTSMSFLGSADRAELLAILRGGNAGAAIRDRMSFAAGAPAWEDAARISAVVDTLAAKCLTEDDSGTAQLGADSLLESAQRLGGPAEQERRKTYLLEAQKLVSVLRTIALNRVTPPPAADALLAGGIALDELAGGLTYNAKSKELSGWGSGQVRLPGMGSSFTMSRVSFSNGGAFELNCHGSVTLPPGANGTARFSVTERRPLKFAWAHPNRFSISGGGRLEVNGMSFEAWATLDDPEYAFGASASGLNFDLANSLRVMVPVFPNAPGFAPAVRVDLLNYVRSMAGNLDTLRSDLNPPSFREPGQMPDFSLGDDFGPFGWIEASVDQIIANHVVGAFGRDYDATIQAVVQSINTLEGQMMKRDTVGDCSSEAAREEMRRTLNILARIDKAVSADPSGPGMNLLALRAAQLREALAPRIECVTAYRAEDDEEEEAKRLAFLLSYGPGDAKVEGAIDDLASSLSQRLTKLGINPATGQPSGEGPLPERSSKKAILAILMTMQMDRALSSAGRDGTVEGHPGADFGNVMQNTRKALARTPWEGLVLEGRRLLVENQRIRGLVAGLGPPGRLIPAGHPVLAEARKLGLDLREWTAQMVEYDQMLVFSGTTPPEGSVPHISGPDGPFTGANAEINAVLTPIMASELDNTMPATYMPVITQVRWPFGGVTTALTSRPVIEGFQRTSVPYGTAEGRNRPLVDLKNEKWVWDSVQPDQQTQPAAYTAWRKATHAARELDLDWAFLPSSTLPAFASQLQLEIQTYLISPNLPGAIHLARETRNLMISLRHAGMETILEDLKVPLGELDAAFKLLVEARKAWWHLAEYTSIFVEGSREFVDQTAGSLGRYFGSTAESSLGLGFRLIDDLALLLPAARPLDVSLPGDLRIDNVFGEVRYNRSTGLLAGSFGGSLTFPDIATNFTLTSLALDNTGNIALNASASGPLPGLDGVRMSGMIALAGRFGLGSAGQPPAVLQDFAGSGSGTATLPDGESFNGTFSYNSTTRVLELATTGTQLDLKLGDHFVLLSGTAGLRFGGVGPGSYPGSGRFDLGGTFGLFRKGPPVTGQPLTPEHFHLAAVEALARLEVDAGSVIASLAQGKLRLPEFFSSPPVPPATTPQRAEIAINTALPPQVVITLGPPGANGLKPLQNVTFSGGVTFTNLGLIIPGFDKAGARDFDGRFDFGNLPLGAFGTVPAATAPKLNIDTGFVFFPHPVNQSRIEIEAADVVWKLDGFPFGTLGLATDVSLFNGGGFDLTMLGAPGAQTTGIEIMAPSGGATLPSLRIFGQLRMLFDNTLLTREATNPAIAGIPTGRFGSLAVGELTMHAPVGNVPPQVDFALSDIGVSGDMRIGGASGVRVTGLTAGSPASILLSGLGNLFNLADVPGQQFIVTLNGKIVQEGLPGFGLGNAKFVFFSPTQPPRFLPDTLEYDGSSWTLAQQLPVELRQAQLRIINNTLPFEQMLHPQNFEITSTFRLGFPNVAKPVFGGGADNVRLTFAANGTPQLQGLEGIELTLDPGLKIPPVEEIGGSIYVTGFSNPANLLMAGRIGGSVNGYKLKFIGAFRSTGPLGLAVDFNAGSAGIPLGPTGFLFTGAGGGVSFLNTSADPMDIRSYVQEVAGKFQANPGNPPPAASMTWNGFKEWGDRITSQIPTFPPIGTGPPLEVIAPGTFPANDPIGCPVNIPPASANIFGMPHPDQVMFPGRYVLKFTSIPEDTLNKPAASGGMGITQDAIASLGQSGATMAETLAGMLRNQIDALTPVVPAVLGSGAQEAEADFLEQVEMEFATIFTQALQALPGNATSAQIYAAIRDKAYAGVTVQDATFKAKGVFTHAAISSFMNIEGGGTIGTTGSAGVTGQVNFLGLPVGSAKLFLSATDVNGNPNPQLTGDVSMALGPLEIGSTKAVLKAEGAVTGLAAVCGQIANTLGQAVIDGILSDMNRDFTGMNYAQAEASVIAGGSLAEQADRLAAFHTAFMAQVLRRPPGTLTDTLLGQVASLVDQVNPELLICSDASIKFAGLKLSNGLAGFKFRMRKTGTEAYFDVAPAGFIGYGTPIAALTSGIDRASMAYAETYPDGTAFFKNLLNGRLSSASSIEAMARQQIATMLENSTMTGTYEVNPLGMTLFRAQARLINPDLAAHPVVRNNNANASDNWVRPGTGTLAAIPTREDLLLQAVRENALGDVFWKGNGNNLNALFGGKFEDLQSRTLTHDYFPHGGLAMAAMLQVPRVLTTLPRSQLATLFDGNAEALARLEALRSIMADYFGTTVQQGHFMAYMPLPNPPALFNGNGTPIVPPPSLDPFDLVKSLKTFNPDSVYPGTLWDLGESFAYLNLEGQLLDIPVATAKLAAVGANPATGAPAMFSGTVTFDQGSWAELLFGYGVNVTANVAGQARTPRRTLDAAFADLQSLDTFGPKPDETALKNAIGGLAAALADVIAQDVPRVELDATVSTFTPPGGWGWAGEIAPVGSLSLSAFTPEFVTPLPPSPTDKQRLQKNGGIAMEGQFKLGNIATTNAQMLVEPPTHARPRPRLTASLTGRSVNLPAPFNNTLANATITFDSEAATFVTVTGTLSSSVDLTAQLGWPVVIPGNASVTVTNHNASFTFTSGGASVTVTADYTNPLAPAFNFSGTLEFDPLITSALSIVPQSGTKLRVEVSNGGATLTNARVKIEGLFAKSANLPPLAVDPGLNFLATAISAPLDGFTVGGFSTSGLTWKVQRTDGVLSITDAQGSVTVAGLGGFSVGFTNGQILSNGNYSFNGTLATGANFTGMPVSSLAAQAVMTFENGAMSFNGTVSGGLLGTNLLPSATTMTNVTLTLSTTAVTNVSGSVDVSAARLGGIEVRPVSENFTLTLNNSGISVPAGQLYFTPWSGTTAIVSTPALTVPSLSAALPATLVNQNSPTTGSFAGFSLNGLTFQLQRASTSPLTYRLANLAFTAPLPSGFTSSNFSVSGGSMDGQSSAINLPLASFPALTVGRFSITNASGTPTLTSSGLSLPGPRFTCSDLGISSFQLPGPPLVVPQSGALTINSLSPGTLAPLFGSLSGFSLGSAAFNISKSGPTMNLTGLTASLTVPGFTASPVSLSGAVPSAGPISFTGAGIPQLGAGSIAIKGPGGGVIPSTLSSGSGLVFSAGSFDVANLSSSTASFASTVNFFVPPTVFPDTVFATFTASPNLRGYALGNSSIQLERNGGVVRLNVTSGSLPLPSGPTLASFNGTISSSGVVSLSSSLSNSTFYGFPLTASFTMGNATTLWTGIMNDTAPRAWWRMEESGSTTVLTNTSSFAPAYNGITDSTTTRPSLQQPSGFQDGTGSGVSMRFDGVDDFYNVPDNANLEGGTAMSVACWFRVNQFTSGKSFHTLIAKGDDSWRLAQDGTANFLSFDTNSTSGAQHSLKASSVPVNDGKWHHVVATFDGNTKRLYIDGILRASDAWSATIRDSTYPVGIGYNPQAANRHWNGWMDEVAIWNTALTPRQVHAMHERGNGIRLSMSGTANLRTTAPVFQPSFAGSITSSGEFDLSTNNLSATLLGVGFNDVDVTFQRRLLPSSTATLTAGATLNPLPRAPGSLPFDVFQASPRFTAGFTYTPAFPSGGTTNATLSAQNVTTKLCGYQPTGAGYTLQLSGNLGTTQNIALSNFEFGQFGTSEITNIGFGALAGTIQPNGILNIATFIRTLNLRNQIATGTTIAFSEAGLYVNAPFTLRTTISNTPRTWGSVSFSGLINPSGSYDLTGSGSIGIGNNPRFNTNSFAMRFRSPDFGTWTVAPAPGAVPEFTYGGIAPKVESFGLHADGYTFIGKASGAKDWSRRDPLPVEDYLFWVLRFEFDFNGDRLDGNIDGQTDWKWKGIYPNGSRGPEHIIKLSGKVGTDGKVSINGNTRVSGTWPVDLGIFSGSDGWNVFKFDGSSDNSFPSAPAKAPLWVGP